MSYTVRSLLVGWLIATQFLLGCARQAERPRFRVAVIPKGTTHAFWQAIHAGARKAAQERGGVQIVWEGPPREDQHDEQQKIIERFLSEGVDAIVLAPSDRRLQVAPAAAVLKKGIPLAIIDSGLEIAPGVQDSPKYLGYVGTNNEEGGRLAAGRMRELFQGRAKVIMLRYQAGSASTELREKGFQDEIRKAKHLDFHVAAEEAGATVDTAQKAAERLLNNHPDVDGLFAPNESSATGVLNALRALKRAGKVTVVGFDGSEVLIGALRNREIAGLVLQDPFRMGYDAVNRAVDALEGKAPPANRTQYTPVRVATLADVDAPAVRAMYAPDLKSFLPK